MPTRQAQPIDPLGARLTAQLVAHRPETPLGRTSNSFEHNLVAPPGFEPGRSS